MPTMKNREEPKKPEKDLVDKVKDFFTRKQPLPTTTKSGGVKG